jgi:hypothetical protein
MNSDFTEQIIMMNRHNWQNLADVSLIEIMLGIAEAINDQIPAARRN